MDLREKVCLVRVNGLRGWLVSVVATFEGTRLRRVMRNTRTMGYENSPVGRVGRVGSETGYENWK